MEKDYMICRCEEVSLKDINDVIKSGASTPQEIKMRTRAGMGLCQGKICRTSLETITQKVNECGIILDNNSNLTIRIPAHPIFIGQIVEEDK